MIVGHKKILGYLERSAKAGTFSHAYIFHGPLKLGKRTVALDFLRKLHCKKNEDLGWECANCRMIARNTFPDFLFIKPDGTARAEIGISVIRELRNKLSLSSHSGGVTTILIDDAERLTREAASALLKTMEEPPREAVFVLVTRDISALPETIVSRAETLSFLPVAANDIKRHIQDNFSLRDTQANTFTRFAFGRPGIAIEMSEAYKGHQIIKDMQEFGEVINVDIWRRFLFVDRILKEKDGGHDFLESWAIWLRDSMMTILGCDDLVVSSVSIAEKQGFRRDISDIIRLLKDTQRTKQIIANTNVNPKLALEALLLAF